MEIYWFEVEHTNYMQEHNQLCRGTAACMPEYQTCAAAAELKAPVIQEEENSWLLAVSRSSNFRIKKPKSELKQVVRSCLFTCRATLRRSGLSYLNC